MFMMSNDTTIVPKGKDPIEFKMPKVAQSYAEFLAMCSATGITAAGAQAAPIADGRCRRSSLHVRKYFTADRGG